MKYEERQSMDHTRIPSKDMNKGQSDIHLENNHPHYTAHENETPFLANQQADHHLSYSTAKQNTTDSTHDIIDFFQQNLGTITPYIKDDILLWIHHLGQPLVLRAMQRTLERGKNNWGYCKGILQSWAHKGFRTLEDAESELIPKSRANQTKYANHPSYASPTNFQKTVPDWFHQQKQGMLPKIEPVVSSKNQEIVKGIIAKYPSS